jgi:hypothetical protein
VYERFDGAGQSRETENGEPIDTSGTFDKAAVSDPAALGAAIGNSTKALQCLVRSAFRYAAGRSVAPDDSVLLDRLDGTFAGSGYRMAALFRTLAISPEFYADPVDRSLFRQSSARSR